MGILRTRRPNIGEKPYTVYPKLTISGNLVLFAPLTASLDGSLFPSAGTYDLLVYTGVLSGSSSNFVQANITNTTLTASAVTHDAINKKFYVVLS